MVTVNIENCWDCINFGYLADAMDKICHEHNIPIYYNRDRLDCSCKDLGSCKHEFHEERVGAQVIYCCKYCGISNPNRTRLSFQKTITKKA